MSGIAFYESDLDTIYTTCEFARWANFQAVRLLLMPQTGYIDAGGLGIAGRRLEYRIRSRDVRDFGVAVESELTMDGATYIVRSLEPLPPLEVEQLLVLEKQ